MFFLIRAVGRENNTPNQREKMHLLGALFEQRPSFIVHLLSASVKLSVSVTGTCRSASAVHNSYYEMKFMLCFFTLCLLPLAYSYFIKPVKVILVVLPGHFR